MMDVVARGKSNGLRGFAQVLGLSALVWAAWGIPARAVTLKGTEAAQLAGLCVNVLEGLSGVASLRPEAKVSGVHSAASRAVPEPEAPAGFEPEVQAGTILELAFSGLHVAAPNLPSGEAHEGGVHTLTSPAASDPGSQAGTHADALKTFMDEAPITASGSGKGQQGAPATVVNRSALGLSPWTALIPLPGLLGVMIALGGIFRNLAQRDDDRPLRAGPLPY